MSIFINRYFVGLLGIGVFIDLFKRMEIRLPLFFQNYCNDLLVLPLVLWIVLGVLIQIKGIKARVSWTMMISIAVYYSVFFEWYMPRVHSRYTADGYDVLCYFIGGSLFMAYQSKIKNLG